VSVYTVRFGVIEAPAGENTTIYTAPSGVTSVVRDLIVVNGGAASSQVWVQIASASGSLETYLYRNAELGSVQMDHLELRQVVEVGELLQVGAVGPSCTFAVTGYQLG
jgi:hypothetical protein